MNFITIMEGANASNIKCKNPNYDCTRPVEKNQSFCIQHILKGPSTSGYKKCTFVTSNGNHCKNARQTDPG